VSRSSSLRSFVDHRPEDDVGLFVGRLLDDPRRFLHFVDGQVGAAREVDEDPPRALDGRFVQERARHGLLSRVQGAVLAPADAGPHERHPHAGHDRADIGEVEIDQPGDEDEIGDSLDGLVQDRIRHLEGLQERRAALHHRQEPLVGDRDERVHHAAELGYSLLRLLGALPPLEGERLRDHGDREDPQLLGHRGNDGRGAGPGAAAQPGRDEDHVGALEDAGDLLAIFLRRPPPYLGVRAGAEAVGQTGAELELHGGRRGAKSLDVGIGDDELDPREPGGHHPAHGVAAAAAEADDLDPRHLARILSGSFLFQLEDRSLRARLLHRCPPP